MAKTPFQRLVELTMRAQRIVLCLLLLFICLIPAPSTAAYLEILPATEVIQFGDANINSELKLPIFTVRARQGSCEVEITANSEVAQIDPPDVSLSDGESEIISVSVFCTVPGDHEFQVEFESNCGPSSRTLHFTCVGGYVNGTVFDFFTKQPVSTAEVTPVSLDTFLHITMVDNGAYSGAGNPGPHYVWVRAEGYREQLFDFTLEQGGALTRDFELVPAGSLDEVIAAIQVVSGFEPSTGDTDHVDVNGDGKMGLDDALLLLQLVSESR